MLAIGEIKCDTSSILNSNPITGAQALNERGKDGQV
jgi:hypothetical protein